MKACIADYLIKRSDRLAKKDLTGLKNSMTIFRKLNAIYYMVVQERNMKTEFIYYQ